MKTSQFLKFSLLLTSFSSLCALSALGQGALTPPGAPGPSMKTLDQISSQISGVSGGGRIALTVQSLETKNISGGSYYLVGNAAGYIIISGSNTTLDLNGYRMVGLRASNTPAIALAPGVRNIVIKNGTIDGLMTRTLAGSPSHPGNATYAPGVEGYNSGIDDDGSNPAQGVVIQDMVIRGCSAAGIFLEGSSRIENVTASLNGGTGIFALNSQMENILSERNGSSGVYTVDGTLV